MEWSSCVWLLFFNLPVVIFCHLMTVKIFCGLKKKRRINKEVKLCHSSSKTHRWWLYEGRISPPTSRKPKLFEPKYHQNFYIMLFTSSAQLPCPICPYFTLFPFSFWQEIVFLLDNLVNNKQIHFLKQNFSATTTPINNRCEMLINHWINPVVCWFFFYVGVDHHLGLLLLK